jgi:hypothetical protein
MTNTIEFYIARSDTGQWIAEILGTKCGGVGDSPDEALRRLLGTLASDWEPSNEYREGLLYAE